MAILTLAALKSAQTNFRYGASIPPALIVFVILTLVALRNNPWLRAYALTFVVVAFVVLFLLAPDPISVPIENVGAQIGFFELPLNIVRHSMVVLTGLILVYLAIRTRRLLSRAIHETVRRTNLSRYLPPQLAARLAQIDQDMLLAGTSQEAAVLFADMRGFTALAEGMEPESLGRFLTRYRRIVSAPVHAQNGIVDKFVGDSVMAVFGAPDTNGNDAANALECATGILHSNEQWNIERRKAKYSDVIIGVGVHWGEVFCGAIGDAARLEFTVLGDTVNVAARLRLHLHRWDQLYLMTQLRDFTCPVVTGSTRLNANQTWLKASKKCQDLCPSQSAVECNFTVFVDTVDLKDVLSQIKADCCNLHGVAPFKQFVTTAVWRIMTPMVQEPSTPSALQQFEQP